MDQVSAGNRPLPYRTTVAVSLAVLHKAAGILREGTVVTVAGRKGIYAQLKNGPYSEALLEVLPSE